MLALSFSILLLVSDEKMRSALGQMVGKILGGCLFESEQTIWGSSLLEDDSYSHSVKLVFSCVHKF